MSDIRHFGYIRVSSKDQNEARQLEAMKDLEILDRDMYIDKMSGKDTNRTGYQLMKNSLRKGDILFIKELDRLGRNAMDIKNEWKAITQDIGAHIVILDMDILDTRKYQNGLEQVISSIVLELLSYMAEREREKINGRQAEGIATALNSGVVFGRPKQAISVEFEEVYKEWKQGNITAVEAMRRVDMKPNTFYRRVKEHEAQATTSPV
ncbi:recombinase family protein [Paenibacillus macquariensis]|uniref:Site-specific DNA recombinase n=1 Tax=Paenibacillus macquariensis TaxID=948756 RepID=A0ABY1K1D6_9BACL|nr:recombinase family protein [Paenibacillus macquariensis]MEC0091799.1 recombinase family protein [Paenibacillus macquariensis]OAB32289.1 DNA recombinase [Paenibacillus macquariensis subsp. macquariensis]SIR11755.1 Site-specific DNA recombinase [Paenibacillus macquariensis]